MSQLPYGVDEYQRANLEEVRYKSPLNFVKTDFSYADINRPKLSFILPPNAIFINEVWIIVYVPLSHTYLDFGSSEDIIVSRAPVTVKGIDVRAVRQTAIDLGITNESQEMYIRLSPETGYTPATEGRGSIVVQWLNLSLLRSN